MSTRPGADSPAERTDWKTWKPGERATLLFVICDGRILLIRKKRGLGAGKINGPGGRLEDGETPEQAALRETHEELGIHAHKPVERGILRFQFLDGYSLECTVFVSPGCDGEAVETDEAAPLWTPLDAIPYDEMWADDRHWLPGMLAGGNFNARFTFDGERMLEHHIEWTVPPQL